ncbi:MULTISPECIES: hypothetical protein [Sphingobium]|uniref:hypothetical protein n=1 Tax=Sphingobium TaxID=165695 RepID=UPI0015EB61D9|nr:MULTISPECIES: hypothetical protein [Sphingobium]MCW2362252.1 hypothetical protein [Sphingobium sp. B10D3B]MCW2401069.1 hypothetical protein [Sphingobium sp. B10D7B]MCW2408049.1 hypothetical protein [Sphingobium xanthum]
MEDFNRLLHDQQRALIDAQFAGCSQRHHAAREAACSVSARIEAHPYPYRLRSTTAMRAVFAQQGSLAA